MKTTKIIIYDEPIKNSVNSKVLYRLELEISIEILEKRTNLINPYTIA
jgi:hypothetical protein